MNPLEKKVPCTPEQFLHPCLPNQQVKQGLWYKITWYKERVPKGIYV